MSALKAIRRPSRAAGRVALIYAVLGGSWVAFSDRIVQAMALTPAQLTTFQTIKGWAFVAVTAVILFLLIRREVISVEKSDRRLQSLVEQSLAGVYVVEEGRLTHVNETLAGVLGYEPEDLVGMRGEDLVHPEDLDRALEILEMGQRGELDDLRERLRANRQDGTVVHLDVVARSVESEGKQLIMGLVLDSSRQVELEEQLRRAQRLEAVGQLTGAVAHDFNNFLTAIMGPLELTLQDLPEDDPHREDLLTAKATAGRAASLSRQLLTFSRKRITDPTVFVINDVVRSMEPMLHRVTQETISLETDLDPEIRPVHMDRPQFEQVVMNLVVNAKDAIPHAGVIRIRTFEVPESPGKLRHRGGLRPGPHVVLEVSDTGSGIPEEVRLKIFEPFFTTKRSGTGLGLSTVFGIVKQAGGFIRVESELHKGSTLQVFLPVTERSPVDPSEDEPHGGRPVTGHETILVVEDEEVVRTTMRRLLERIGYTVMAAADGAEALKIWEEKAADIDLVVSDVMLPETTGPELASRLRQQRSDVAILFTSGYSEPEALRTIQGTPRPFLEKPFSIKQLEEKVRETLARRPGDEGEGKF